MLGSSTEQRCLCDILRRHTFPSERSNIVEPEPNGAVVGMSSDAADVSKTLFYLRSKSHGLLLGKDQTLTNDQLNQFDWVDRQV
jgi:hypothetical protein